jgi:hypothetical protein
MNRLLTRLVLLVSCIWILTAALAGSQIDPEDYLAHIKFLASPELKGRRTGTPELEKAAGYIAGQFRAAGLQTLAGSYMQEFDVTARTALGPEDSLSIQHGSKPLHLTEQRDFVPLDLSSNGSATGTLVFAGYGITAPEYHYDDYAGIDVRGKIVLVLRHEPQENDEKSVFAGKNYTTHSELSSKIANAKLHGASGLLLVNDAPNHPGGEDHVDKFIPIMATEDVGLVVEEITAKLADELLAQSKSNGAHRTPISRRQTGEELASSSGGASTRGSSEDLASIVRTIDHDTKPHSFEISPPSSATLTVSIAQEKRHVHNVVGWIPGRTQEYVILGAHYDHLGLGEQDSLAPSQIGTVHPGADDNASGTAGVIELARHLAHSGEHRRGFLFICFAGEEEGLLGSSYYANHPLRPLSNAVAMINMDMIGRLRDNKVYVGGIGTGSTFKQIVDRASTQVGLRADESEAGGYGASDHTSFTAKKIPTLFFFSGLHSDYHKPSDTWDKINAKDAVRLLDDVSEVAIALTDAPERPTFVRVESPAHSGNLAASGSGYGPYFGSIPDFGSPANGVRFADIHENSPAGKAGLRAGDILIEFDGKPIQNLYDFTYALRQHKPGDTVVVKVLRGEQKIQATAKLTTRP